MESVVEREYTPMVGVDIGPDYIRIVELEPGGQDYQLKRFVIERTPEGCVSDGMITDPREVARALKSAFKQGGFSTKNAVAAVRGSRVVSRLLSLPAMPQDRLRRLIETEINRYVLFGKNDRVVFYHPLEEFEEEGRRRVAIMLVVADKAICNSYYQTLQMAGLNCIALDTSVFSMLRVLRNRMPVKSGSMLSVAYDYNALAMTVFHGDTIRFSRSIRMEKISSKELGNGFMDKFMTEMLLALQFYQSEFPRGEPIRKIVLSLGASGGMSIYDRLSGEVSGIPVELHAPFSNIKIDVRGFSKEQLEKVDFNFITSVGLALRGQEREPLPFRVDLLPADVVESREFSRILTTRIIPALLVLVFVLGGLFIRNNTQINVLKSKNGGLESKRVQLQSQITALVSSQSNLAGKTPEIPTADPLRPGTDLLRQLQTTVPMNVQLLELKYTASENGRIELKAAAPLEAAATAQDDFLSALSHSGVLADMAPAGAEATNIAGQAISIFSLQGRYQPK